jgi:hypothetical protein
MPGQRLTIDIAYDRGDAVNWLGCNGHVTALIVLDGSVQYEVQFLDRQGQACLGRFQHFELEEGHED